MTTPHKRRVRPGSSHAELSHWTINGGDGSAASVGLCGFASATVTLSVVLAGWFPHTTVLYAVVPLLVTGGIASAIGSLWSYLSRITFFAILCGFFSAVSVVDALALVLTPTGFVTGQGGGTGIVAIVFICIALIDVILLLHALRINKVLVGMLGCLSLAHGLLGTGDALAGTWNLIGAGGWAGIGAALLAFYTAAALQINSASGRPILPLGRPLIKARRRLKLLD